MMMSPTENSFLCHSLKISSAQNIEQRSTVAKISFQNYGKEKLPLFHNDQMNNCSTRNSTGKTGFLYKDFHYFPLLHHPLESELSQMDTATEPGSEGIGIVSFFEGKNIFITGATGLVGKVFIEKLLRSTSVGKIYILIKAEDKGAAFDRLQKDIVNSELFDTLREKHCNDYETFVKEKLIPIVGNICEPNLGMDAKCSSVIMKEVDIIVGSAASTTLNDRLVAFSSLVSYVCNEYIFTKDVTLFLFNRCNNDNRYDYLLDINVNATQRLMRFAKTCPNLKLFVHMSTAYVNGRKEGLIIEKPLTMGETGMKEDDEISVPRLDLADEISVAMKSFGSSTHCDVTKDLKRLGQERADSFGWYNAYHMTKAMGEMVLNEIREDVPVLIIRPTVIESSLKEPVPGWIQGNRMFDPVIISYGKGQLPAFLADPHAHMDIIPVDMVVNTTIAAIAKHGSINKPQLNVYQVATGVENPLQFSEFFDILHEYFKLTPLFMSNDIKKAKCFDNYEDFSKYTRDEISRLQGALDGVDEKTAQKQYKAKVAYAEQLCKMYKFIGFFNGRFHTGNTQKLLREMSKEEQVEFEIDANTIDWRKYFLDIHIPGLAKYVLKAMKTSSSYR